MVRSLPRVSIGVRKIKPSGPAMRLQSTIPVAHPWHDLPVIKPDDEFHLHRHFAAQPFHDPDDVRILATRRHEIDQAHGAALGFDFRFQDQRVATVTATRRLRPLLPGKTASGRFSYRPEAKRNTRANRTAEDKANQHIRPDSPKQRFAYRLETHSPRSLSFRAPLGSSFCSCCYFLVDSPRVR